MTKFSRWIIPIFIGVICTACMPSISDIETEIKTNIPIGSSKEKVVAYLESHGYEHSANDRPDIYYNKDKIINAQSKKSYGFFLAEGKIYLIFEFDQKDKLKSYKVDTAYTGL